MSTPLRTLLAPAGALLALLAAGSAHADGTPAPEAPPPAAPAVTPASPPSLYETHPADTRAVDDQAGRTRFGFGANLTTDYYRAPLDVLGIGVFLELGQTENAGVWAPLVRLTGQGAVSSVGSGMDSTKLTWFTLALDGCPIQATLVARRVWIRPCARVSGGVLSASATVDQQALDTHKPWVTAGVLARLQWRPVGPLFFEVEGGAAYAFTHDAVSLAPSGSSMSSSMSGLPVLEPALFEPFGSLGVGLTFP